MSRTTILLGVPGLDAIFPHGIEPGSLILISGPPGSGKTLLSMQLLMEMRFKGHDLDDPRRGKRLLYTGDERKARLDLQKEHLLLTRWSSELQVLELEPQTPLQMSFDKFPAVATVRGSQKQLDLEIQFPYANEAHLLRRRECATKAVIENLDRKQNKAVAFGVDGILNLPEFRGATLGERRAALQAIAGELRELVAWEDTTKPPKYLAAIMTAELPPGQDTDAYLLEEYLADIVMRVDVDAPLAGKRRRRLEVIKCRYADSVPGEHSLWIMSQNEIELREKTRSNLGWSREAVKEIRKGIVVFPRFRWRAKSRTQSLIADGSTRPCCRFGIKGLDEMFERSTPGVMQGSSTVLVGEAGTGKSMLCYSFLLKGLVEKQHVIFISFDQRRRSILREAGALTCDQSGTTLLDAVRAQVELHKTDQARLRFIHENPVNVDLDQLMHLLTQELEACSKSADQPGWQCRLIIDSLSDLERNLPEPIEFNDFVIALLNLAADFQATTLIAYEAERGSDRVMSDGRALPFMADNVVRIGYVEVNDAARKCISIQKARGRKHDASIGELVFCAGPKSNTFHVEVSKGFEGMHNVLSGHPKSAQIRLRLFTENRQEDCLNREFVREIRRHYGAERVKAGSFAVTQMRDIFWNREKGRDIQPDSDVTIVSLDQPWVRLFASTWTAQPLAMWDPETADASQKLAVSQVKPTLRRHATVEPKDDPFSFGKMVALPHYYDLGLLVRRTDVLTENIPVPRHWENIGDSSQNSYSFESMARQVKDQTGLYSFAFSTEEVESVSCTFMEMCWNFFATRDFLVNRKDKGMNLERVTDALAFLSRLRRGGLLPFPCTIKDCSKSLYSRVWYSNLFNMADPGLTEGKDGQPSRTRMVEPVSLPFKPIPFLTSALQYDAAVRGALEVGIEEHLKLIDREIDQVSKRLKVDPPAPAPGASLNRASWRSWLRYLELRRKHVREIGESPVQGWACSGAWYLGVLAAGSNVNLGWSIVKEAVSPSRLESRALAGAGLAVYEEFYVKHGSRPVPWLTGTTFDQLANQFYWNVRSRTDAFGLQPGRETQVRDVDAVCQMPETIHSLVTSVLDDDYFHGSDGRKRIAKEVDRLLETTMAASVV